MMSIKQIMKQAAWGNKGGFTHKTMMQVTAVLLVAFVAGAALRATLPARAIPGELVLEADFSASHFFGQANRTVQFSDLSIGNPEGWAWYFGDDELNEPWAQYDEHIRWSGRESHTSVVLSDGSILIMGGSGNNDVWRSEDGGIIWTQATPNAGWSGRSEHTSVVLGDGSVLVMGGYAGSTLLNDVWISEDGGYNWSEVTPDASWPERHGHTSVALSDGTVLVLGGRNFSGVLFNDVWFSEDNGANWAEVPVKPGWSGRHGHSSVVLSDGGILVIGGRGLDGSFQNDVWLSEDGGFTWTEVTDNAGWSGFPWHSSVVLSDGSIFVMGGSSLLGSNEVWCSVNGGANWNKVTTSTYWDEMVRHSSVVLSDDSILVIGRSASVDPQQGRVWLSQDRGENWTQRTYPWCTGRAYHASVVLPDGSILVMGGNSLDGFNRSDVWRSLDGGLSWTMVTHAEWPGRTSYTSVVLGDGSVLVMGGSSGSVRLNDVWRSEDGGVTWTCVTPNADWSGRFGHTSVVLSDGSILVMGGRSEHGYLNDVWRSEDGGTNWTEVTASAPWPVRAGHTSVALADGNVLIMGGYYPTRPRPETYFNDVWHSDDGGATWTLVTDNPGWPGRTNHTSVVLPDDSILVLGGREETASLNDVWQSRDGGASWTCVTPNANWPGRYGHTSVVLADGSVLMMNGISNYDPLEDIWRWQTAGSTEQDPQHTFTREGVYRVALQTYTGTSYDRKIRYVYVGNYGLTGLTVSEGVLEPAFDPNIDNYTVSVGSNVDSLDITASHVVGTTRLFINGEAAVSGAPRKVSLREGENTITVTWSKWDKGLRVITDHTYTIRIYRGELSVSTQHLPVAVPGLPYSISLEAAGGTVSYTWSVSGLPVGLALVGSEVSGTVTETGDYPLLVTVEDGLGNSVQKNLTLRVRNATGNGAFSVTPEASPAYSCGLTSEGIVTMTVNEGISGFQNFSAEVLPLTGHPGQEVLVFVHLRGDVQLGISATRADFDNLQGFSGGAGFNVQPGDVIKVYLVDRLSTDPDHSPRIL